HLVVKQGCVGHVAYIAAGLFYACLAQNRDRAPRGMCETGEDPQKASLASAIVTHNDVELSPGEAFANPSQRGETAELFDQTNGDDSTFVWVLRHRRNTSL